MSDRRQDKLQEAIREQAARFVTTESDRTSLITVTHVVVSTDLKSGIVFFTVYPEAKEAVVLEFLNRKRKHFRDELMSKLSLRRIPRCEFRIDSGEKNRQRIDTVLSQE